MEDRSSSKKLGNNSLLGAAGRFERRFVSLLTEYYSGSPISVTPQLRILHRGGTHYIVDCALFYQDGAKPIALFDLKQNHSQNALMRSIRFFQAAKSYGVDDDAKYYFVCPAHSEAFFQSKPLDENDVEIYDITQAVTDNAVPTEDDLLRNQVSINDLPSPISAECSFAISKKKEWDTGNVLVKVICWAILPAIAIALVILDLFGIFPLSWQNLSVLGFAACCVLLPTMRYIKIGTFEASLLSRKKDDKKQNQ